MTQQPAVLTPERPMSQLRLHSALVLARPEGRGCIMLPWLSSSGGLPGKATRLLAMKAAES